MDGWNSTTMEHGEQSVRMALIKWLLMLCANNLIIHWEQVLIATLGHWSK